MSGPKMSGKMINVGYGNTVPADRIIAVIQPSSSPMKRLKDEAREAGRLLDATQGKKTRSVIITDSNHVILSAVQADTISQRYNNNGQPDTPKK